MCLAARLGVVGVADGLVSQKDAQIAQVISGWSGNDGVAEGGEKRIGVEGGESLADGLGSRGEIDAGNGAAVDNCARGLAVAVDAVGAGAQDGDVGSGNGLGAGESELLIASADAAVAATRAGFAVEVDNSCDDWPCDKAAAYLVNRLRELRNKVSRVCLISGGEVTVTVRNGGCGGRNQQFALACAEPIAGDNITVLSAGTDGIDGNSLSAGAIVDGSTLARVDPASGGETVRRALATFNADPLFSTLGDAIVTGATGNNLRDLRVLLAY